ncbi:hypothetical protein FQA47_013830 [Oryzias melastigma]|uniref:Uncharacterized protein n=1 Tax=Oryzias melastigma TaxID=30732 RepID=A0A834BU72_ORYME|nr:hypothetical protein FQA47_013830 [Oryzias melastigma]
MELYFERKRKHFLCCFKGKKRHKTQQQLLLKLTARMLMGHAKAQRILGYCRTKLNIQVESRSDSADNFCRSSPGFVSVRQNFPHSCRSGTSKVQTIKQILFCC